MNPSSSSSSQCSLHFFTFLSPYFLPPRVSLFGHTSPRVHQIPCQVLRPQQGVRRAEGKRRAGYVRKGRMTGRWGEKRKERESPVRCTGIPWIPPASEWLNLWSAAKRVGWWQLGPRHLVPSIQSRFQRYIHWQTERICSQRRVAMILRREDKCVCVLISFLVSFFCVCNWSLFFPNVFCSHCV